MAARGAAHGRQVAMLPAGHDGAADSGSHVIVLACGGVRVQWPGKDLYRTVTISHKKSKDMIGK